MAESFGSNIPGVGTRVPTQFTEPLSVTHTFDPGRRFVPAPTPGQAAWNTALRNYAPWGPMMVDPSPTGTMGKWGTVAGLAPYVGGGLQAVLASQAARERQGQMVEIQPTTGWDRFMNILGSIGNTLRFTPGGGAMGMAKTAFSAARGLLGAPEALGGTTWGEMLGGAGGLATRNLMDRTGILGSRYEAFNEPAYRTPTMTERVEYGTTPTNVLPSSMPPTDASYIGRPWLDPQYQSYFQKTPEAP